MEKKRCVLDRKYTLPKKGQITVFIIIGILLLFTFIFITVLTSSLAKNKLETEQQKIVSTSFSKESMRLYVEDCLQDELEKGLILLGKQGRIWDTQPGGTRTFMEGVTGVTFGGEKIFYGITDKKYNLADAYPCKTEANPPQFCEYSSTTSHSNAGFGEAWVKTSTIKEDLSAYLKNRTVWCVENFTKSNISKSVQIETADFELNLEFQNEGISISADYPLKFKLAGKEFFQLSKFDFFYPSKFEQLLKAAVAYPLEKDQRYVDFEYDEQNLQNQPGSAYNSLGIDLEIQELDEGDDLFIFTPATSTIIDNPLPYSYAVVRQNRPPALNYVNRYPCLGANASSAEKEYDYLVIKGAGDEMGNITIQLSAQDPDEDAPITYSFADVAIVFNGYKKEGNNFSVDNILVSAIKTGIYALTGTASDPHKKLDGQKIRVLVDNPIDAGIKASLPYAEVLTTAYTGPRIASIEDPLFVEITTPAKPFGDASATAILKYENTNLKEKFEIPLFLDSLQSTQCFNFPAKDENEVKCTASGSSGGYSMDKYKDKLNNWPSAFNAATFNHFTELGSGKLTVSLDIDYCGGYGKKGVAAASEDLIVVECVPHKNAAHPFASPYEKYTFGLNSDGSTNFGDYKGNTNINPLEATHSCCIGISDNLAGWSLKSKSDSCFVNPKPVCLGKIKDYTSLSKDYSGYILEQEVRYCDGERGNVCGGELKSELWEDKLICGSTKNDSSCNKAAKDCAGFPAFSLILDKGWCSGMLGCQKLCISEIVIVRVIGKEYYGTTEINKYAKAQQTTNPDQDKNFPLKCGCSGNENKPCDANFDGYFDGICQSGDCCGTDEPGAEECVV